MEDGESEDAEALENEYLEKDKEEIEKKSPPSSLGDYSRIRKADRPKGENKEIKGEEVISPQRSWQAGSNQEEEKEKDEDKYKF